jgi:hypothetical protein
METTETSWRNTIVPTDKNAALCILPVPLETGNEGSRQKMGQNDLIAHGRKGQGEKGSERFLDLSPLDFRRSNRSDPFSSLFFS